MMNYLPSSAEALGTSPVFSLSLKEAFDKLEAGEANMSRNEGTNKKKRITDGMHSELQQSLYTLSLD